MSILANILFIMNFTLFRQPSEILLEIAQRMKDRRKAKGYTQAELAVRSQVSLGSLKRFEQKGKISLVSLLNLAQVLDNLDDFDHLFSKKNEIDPGIEKLFE